MNILVIGSGGREHAIVKKIKESPRVDRVLCLRGTPGMQEDALSFDIDWKNRDDVLSLIENEKVGLTIIGPEAPLVDGLSDFLSSKGHRVFGPSGQAAMLEGSKAFAKKLMWDNAIATASGKICTDVDDAVAYIREQNVPLVVKASGLAAGKGVLICGSAAEAEAGVRKIMQDRIFGTAGDIVVLEETLSGREVSLLYFTDGRNALPMLPAQDHKRIFDEDMGPNTGGMGAFCPSTIVDDDLIDEVRRDVVEKVLQVMQKMGCIFRGVMYVGLMLTEQGYRVLEFNARFGDPETQVILPLLSSDLVDVMDACIDGCLDKISLKWSDRKSLCVVLASEGYPGNVKDGRIISGLNTPDLDTWVVHAATEFGGQYILTSGGRVLNVVATAKNFQSAREKVYNRVNSISFDGMQYRKDIGINADL